MSEDKPKENKMVINVLCFFAWIYGQMEGYQETIDESENIFERMGGYVWATCDFVVMFPIRFYNEYINRE